MKWRAYYSDGYRVDSSQASWAQIPDDDLVGVVVFETAPNRHLMDGYDWVLMEDGELHTVYTHLEWGKWADPPPLDCNSCLKRGGAMSDADFKALQAEMFEDRLWP